ncbi:MAG: methionyl-tRNA formyltransferase [Candidatus Levybacteria bacterium]|nr:methionyl-tRNA formyltransferase [Candidatus Levybacteria bacterium]
MNLKIVFFGTPTFVIPILENLSKHVEIVGVITTPDSPQGRHHVLTPTPVKQFATTTFPPIPILTPEKLDNETKQILEDIKPDIFVVAAYGKIIPQSILDIPKYGSINIHPSLLPKYRGSSPIQTMLLHGDKESGVTIMLMDEKMDHGPILKQWTVPVSNDQTFESLHQSMFKDAADQLPQVIHDFVEKKLTPIPQNDNDATYCEKTTKESGYFDSANPPMPDVLDRMIRAFYPWPSVWTRLTMPNGSKQIIKFYPEKRIQVEGKKIVTIEEFLNGYPKLRQQLEQLLPEGLLSH